MAEQVIKWRDNNGVFHDTEMACDRANRSIRIQDQVRQEFCSAEMDNRIFNMKTAKMLVDCMAEKPEFFIEMLQQFMVEEQNL